MLKKQHLIHYRKNFIYNLTNYLILNFILLNNKFLKNRDTNSIDKLNKNFYNHIINNNLNFNQFELSLLTNIYKFIPKSIKGINGKKFTGKLFIHEEDMISYAANQSFKKKVAVLNMANKYHPGGGFINGAMAQEEVLCNRSTLYPGLLLAKYQNKYPIPDNSSLVITEGVKILLDNNYQQLDNPTPNIVIISCAAKRYDSEYQANQDKNLNNYIYQNWLSIIHAANLSEVDELIISALGAGAFNNPPEQVGHQLVKALHNCSSNNLKKISLIILNDHNGLRGEGNYLRMTRAIYSSNNKYKNKLDIIN